MRAFLEEYGIAIFVLAVLGILIVMATPVGTRIKAALLNKINNLENCVQVNELNKLNTAV